MFSQVHLQRADLKMEQLELEPELQYGIWASQVSGLTRCTPMLTPVWLFLCLQTTAIIIKVKLIFKN